MTSFTICSFLVSLTMGFPEAAGLVSFVLVIGVFLDVEDMVR